MHKTMNKDKKDNISIVDSVEFVHYDKNGKVINRGISRHGLFHRLLVKLHLRPHNSITIDGFTVIAKLAVADVGETAYEYMQIGTGTTGATKNDHQLETPKGVRQLTTGSVVTTDDTNDTAQWVASFSKAIDATLTGIDQISEIGIFNHVSADHKMLLHIIFDAEKMDWDQGDSITFTVKCQMKQGS